VSHDPSEIILICWFDYNKCLDCNFKKAAI